MNRRSILAMLGLASVPAVAKAAPSTEFSDIVHHSGGVLRFGDFDTDWQPTAHLRTSRIGGGWVIQQKWARRENGVETHEWRGLPKA